LRSFIAAAITLLSISSASAQPFDWSGFYAGIHGGFGQTDVRVGNLKPRGEMAGFHLGINRQVSPHLVVGVEGDLGTAAISDRSSYWTVYNDLTHIATVRGRIGIPFDRWLFFTSYGYAYGTVKHTLFSTNEDVHGYAYSFGIEYAMPKHFNLRFEYLVHDVEVRAYREWRTEIVRAGISYRF
jgi:outer membrane immunogenic protein